MATKRALQTLADIERAVERVTESGCWIWMGKVQNKGYAIAIAAKRDYGTTVVHRIAYQIAYGPFPRDLLVCHRCDVRCCVNPTHLFLGTNLDNTRDMDRKGRGRRGLHFRDRTHCLHGHALNEHGVIRTHSHGYKIRICQQCERERALRHYHRKGAKPEEVAA